jgi:hypothetical protein
LQFERLAADLGGKLEIPQLRWKYAWIRPIFGYDLAKRAQFLLPQIKWLVESSWDKAMFHLENRRLLPVTPHGSELRANS